MATSTPICIQVVPGSRVAGPARTVRCGQDDNLMVHAVMAEIEPGEVIVLTMPEPRPVALVGDLLATQAKAQGAAAMLVDAAVRDVEELAELGLPIWARWVRVHGAVKETAGEIDEPVTVGGAHDPPGDIVVLDADGVAVVERERVDEVLAASRARAENERVKRAKLQRRCALLRPRRTARASSSRRDERAAPDLAHIGHAELLTPSPTRACAFFVDLFGMEIEAQEEQSVYLRGWGDYQRYSLKLTESELPGLGHMAIRAWSPEALQRRVASIERTGLGDGWIDGDLGHGPVVPLPRPRRAPLGAVLRGRALRRRPSTCARRCSNVPQRYTRPRRRASSGSTTSTCSPPTSPPTALCARSSSATGCTSRSSSTTARESGAWMSLTIAAHELIYVADDAGANGRLHHLAFLVDTREECLRAADLFLDADVPIEAAPSKHAVAQGMFLYVYEPGGNRVEVTTGTHFIYDPAYEPVAWTQAERARGQAWGVKTIETFHTYGTPDTSGEATGPPIPPTSRIPGQA